MVHRWTREGCNERSHTPPGEKSDRSDHRSNSLFVYVPRGSTPRASRTSRRPPCAPSPSTTSRARTPPSRVSPRASRTRAASCRRGGRAHRRPRPPTRASWRCWWARAAAGCTCIDEEKKENTVSDRTVKTEEGRTVLVFTNNVPGDEGLGRAPAVLPLVDGQHEPPRLVVLAVARVHAVRAARVLAPALLRPAERLLGLLGRLADAVLDAAHDELVLLDVGHAPH